MRMTRDKLLYLNQELHSVNEILTINRHFGAKLDDFACAHYAAASLFLLLACC